MHPVWGMLLPVCWIAIAVPVVSQQALPPCNGTLTTTPCVGCDGGVNSTAVVDACGVCNGTSSTCPCDPNPALSCSSHGTCNSQYQCTCIDRWFGSNCSTPASLPITLSLSATLASFNTTLFVRTLASAAGTSADNVAVLGVTSGSVIVRFVFASFVGGPSAAADAFNSFQALVAAISSTSPNPLHALGVISVTVKGQPPVIVHKLVLSCDQVGCPRLSNIGAAFDPSTTSAASFTPSIAGNYTFQVSVTDRCWSKTSTISITARCSNSPPVARIVKAPNPIVYNTGDVVLNASTSINGNGPLGLLYKWCITSDPKGSSLVNDTSSVARFRVTAAGTFSIRLLVSDGCAVSSADTTIVVVCNCAPNVRIGFVPTVTATEMRGATAPTPLVGSATLNYEHAIGQMEPLSFSWRIKERSPVPSHTLVDVVDSGNTRTYSYRAGPVSLQGVTHVNTSATTILTNTTAVSLSPLGGASVAYPKTSSLASLTLSTLVTSQTRTSTQTLSTTTFTPDCSISIINYTQAVASFQASSYQHCQGLYVVELEATDGCAVDRSETALTVACNRAPSAVAGCVEYVEWKTSVNGGPPGFPTVSLDGRESKDAPGETLTYTWTITSLLPPTAATPTPTVASNSVPAPTPAPGPASPPPALPTVVNAGSSLANFRPGLAGTYNLRLSVTDGCSTSVDDVAVVAVCFALTANISSALPYNATHQALEANVFSSFTLSAANTQYSVRGDRTHLRYYWALLSRPPSSIMTVNVTIDPALATLLPFSPDAKGYYTFRLTVTDGCSTSISQQSVYANCPSGWTNIAIPAATISNTSPILLFNYTSLTFPNITYTLNPPPSSRSLYFQMRVTINGQPSALYSRTTLSLDNSYTLAPQTAGVFTLVFQVTDTCNVYTPQQPLPVVTFSCGTQPTPSITPTTAVQQGVTYISAQLKYIVAFNTSLTGFYPVKLSCHQSVSPMTANRFECVWDWNPLHFTQIGATAANGDIVLKPVMVGTHPVRLTVRDGCYDASPLVSAVTIETSCPRGAFNLLQGGGPTITSTIAWAYPLGTFETARLNGTVLLTATQGLQSTDYLTYTWSFVNTPVPLPALVGDSNGIATFVPNRVDTFTVALAVTDGCSSSSFYFVVTTSCAPITAAVVGLSAQGFTNQISDWDGNSFRAVSLSGHSVGPPLNARLSFLWHVLSAPSTSKWSSTYTTTTATATNSTSASTTTVPPPPINATTPAIPAAPAGGATVYTTVTNTSVTTTTRVESVVLVEPLVNDLGPTASSTVCFVPDVAGEYVLRVSVSTGCVSAIKEVRIATACNTPPVVRFGKETQTVSLDGLATTRAYVDASASSDPDGDYLSFAWTVTGPASFLSSDTSPIASFVPPRAGVYSARVDVSDGCQIVSRVATITVDCAADLLAVTTSASTSQVLFQPGSSLTSGAFPAVNLSAALYPVCTAVTQFQWSFVSQTCVDPFLPPPVSTPSPTPTPCNNTTPLSYVWSLASKPCASAKTSASIVNATAMRAAFKPDTSGTFVLQLAVSDTCSTSTDTTTIVARCTRDIAVDAGSPVTVLYACGGGGFPSVDLSATAAVTQDPQPFVSLAPCLVAPTPPPAITMPELPVPPKCCSECPPCLGCARCLTCQERCTCPSTLGWARQCVSQPKTVTVQVLRTVLVATTCSGGGAPCTEQIVTSCPSACTAPTCACAPAPRVVTESQQRMVQVCKWVNVPIPGMLYPYAPGMELTLPRARRAPVAAAPIRFSLRQIVDDAHDESERGSSLPEGVIDYEPSTYYLPGGTVGGIVVLALLFVASMVVNVVYAVRLRRRYQAFKTAPQIEDLFENAGPDGTAPAVESVSI